MNLFSFFSSFPRISFLSHRLIVWIRVVIITIKSIWSEKLSIILKINLTFQSHLDFMFHSSTENKFLYINDNFLNTNDAHCNIHFNLTVWLLHYINIFSWDFYMKKKWFVKVYCIFMFSLIWPIAIMHCTYQLQEIKKING